MRKVDQHKSFDEKVSRTCSWERYLDDALVMRAEQKRKLLGRATYSVSEFLSDLLKPIVIGPEYYTVMERQHRMIAEMFKHQREVRDGRAMERLDERKAGERHKDPVAQIELLDGLAIVNGRA